MTDAASTDTVSIRHPTLRLAASSLLAPLGLGLLLRFLLLILAGSAQPIYDEASYVRNAQVLSRTWGYDDVWPPGYPFIIALGFRFFGAECLHFVRLFQVFCSITIGFGIVQMSHMLFGVRGALISGYAWALYLPLAFYTHRLWPETLTLTLLVPAVYLLCSYSQAKDSPSRGRSMLVCAGVLFGLSLYMKEVHTYLAIPLAFWLMGWPPRRVRRALLFPLSVLLVLLPLTARNYKHYGRFVLIGATLDANIRWGLNSFYFNHDYNRDPLMPYRIHTKADGSRDFVRRNFMAYGQGWKLSAERDIIERTREDIEAALRYAVANRGRFLLTRIKKVADFVTPLSFLVRDLVPEVYSGVLVWKWVRRSVICLGLGSVMILLPVGWVNLIRLRYRRREFVLFVLILGYFAGCALLVSMSRYRIPVVPYLLILAGGSVVRRTVESGAVVTVMLSAAGLVVLAALWALNFAEVCAVVSRSWG